MARSHPVDVHVGARMRQRRTLLGMSQEKLGTAVGLTFQQIQKYERGSIRIGSSRLFQFAKVLDVSVSYFFAEMLSKALAGRPMSGRGRKSGFGEAATPFEQEKDPIRINKFKEVYDLLEQTTDYCEDVAVALQNVVVKNS